MKRIKDIAAGRFNVTATGIAAVVVAAVLATWVLAGAFLFIYAKYLQK
jgi:hypothetical protein